MPGHGKKSGAKKSSMRRREQTDGTGDQAYEDAPVRYCSRDQCFNHHNLKECGRCRSAYYCSVECQRSSWQKHKPECDHNSQGILPDGEPLLRRNLRNWSVRFDASLLNACLRGLMLKTEWERLDHGAIVVFLEPRRHVNQGSRWRILNVGAFRTPAIMDMLKALGDDYFEQYRDHVFPLHERERKRLQESSGGIADYAKVILIARNAGPEALEGEEPIEVRFKPVDVWRPLAAAFPLAQYEGDWCEDLKNQVHDDRPMKHGGSALLVPTAQ
ncbi:hypothetical protein B0H16DRAFT_1602299 [Mycena metata]|uniref:MYND-type domain-containing protein n=1 Tax=Mycena metata TaxID=1033252 RepID=A0AAD7HIP2_9AGAR|nr:hypothetical protein B0H16DRAFT_1602299 [Mycena metata]